MKRLAYYDELIGLDDGATATTDIKGENEVL
jgi:hypothetical protein